MQQSMFFQMIACFESQFTKITIEISDVRVNEPMMMIQVVFGFEANITFEALVRSFVLVSAFVTV
jgi:hypothetical protein